jgi:uncharacterized membrane protein
MDSSVFLRAGTACSWLLALLAALNPEPARAQSFDPYIENFNDGVANGWQPLSGTWSATSRIYTNNAIIATAITRSSLGRMWGAQQATADLPYTFKVRMLNPYHSRGNLIGVAWVRDARNYTEAVFSPTGEARLNSVSNGVRSTIASASYLGGGPSRWFEVEVGNDGNNPREATHIKVNGVPVFDVAPNVRSGELSFITHWAPGRFDDVRAAPRFFTPFFEDFNDGNAAQFVRSGPWSISNGALNNSAVVKAARALVQKAAGWHELADIELRARMINRFQNRGNLVGFTYGARGSVYFEAVFSPTGVAHLRRVVNDEPSVIATARYAGGGHLQPFDAQLIQSGARTTVKVNAATVFDNVLQPEAVGGDLGFVAHWTVASVDDVSLTQIPVTRYRFTALPDLPNPTVLTSGVRAINDLGEVVGLSRTDTIRVARRAAVLWRNGRVIELGANADDGSVANDINNKSEIVGSNFGQQGFYWKDGQLERFPAGCDRGDANGINERGQIVGTCGAGGDGTSAMLKEPDGRLITLEDLPGGFDWSIAWAVNEHGEVVGESSAAESPPLLPVSWQDGTVEPLGSEGTAFDINNRGQIIGIVPKEQQQRAVMWQDRKLIFLPMRVGEFHAQALGVNEHGVIVGSTAASRPDNPNRESRATLWQEGRVVDLNELIVCGTLPESTLLTSAMDINERGEIAVNGFDFTVLESKAFVLTPVSGRESCDP